MSKTIRTISNVITITALVSGLTLAISTSAAAPADAATYNTSCSNRHLSRGDRGTCVSDAQRKLMSKNVNPGTIDGIFGDKTAAAVVQFQKNSNLNPDGIVGPDTWRALNATTTAPAAPATTQNASNNPASRIGTNQLTNADVNALLPSSCRTTAKSICIIKGSGSTAVVVAVQNEQVVKYAKARTGDARGSGSVTTTGPYHVNFKDIDHVSSIYEAQMPDSIFFHGDQAIHYSADFNRCGYSKSCGQGGSSHGCVNIASRSFADWLYGWTPESTATKVTVVKA
jgi:peptidoglycan hydrolase-like protein with peptidoglycan-binding domain